MRSQYTMQLQARCACSSKLGIFSQRLSEPCEGMWTSSRTTSGSIEQHDLIISEQRRTRFSLSLLPFSSSERLAATKNNERLFSLQSFSSVELKDNTYKIWTWTVPATCGGGQEEYKRAHGADARGGGGRSIAETRPETRSFAFH